MFKRRLWTAGAKLKSTLQHLDLQLFVSVASKIVAGQQVPCSGKMADDSSMDSSYFGLKLEFLGHP